MTNFVKRSYLLVGALALGFAGCSSSSSDDATVNQHLALFDELDFQAYDKQDWTLFRQIHCDDIVFNASNGQSTMGIDAHVASAQSTFVWAPDASITDHSIKVGTGDYTSVTAHLHLTFTKPLPLPDGSMIPPTNKDFTGQVDTVALWRGDCIAEEDVYFPDTAIEQKALGLSM